MILKTLFQKKWLIIAIITIGTLAGCETTRYHWQIVKGHSAIQFNREPIRKLINDSEIDEKKRTALKLVLDALAFANTQLSLPSEGSYEDFVDIGRDYVVWNVFGAPEFSVSPEQWCFVLVGCISYRGYYAEADAHEYAQKLKKQGLDTYVGGVGAYSTLGWFNDPVLSNFLRRSEASLVGLIFHELTHQRVYIKNDSEFNESLATAVEQAGVKLWFEEKQNSEATKQHLERHSLRKVFIDHVQQLRGDLNNLYQRREANELNDAETRDGKREIIKASLDAFDLLIKEKPKLKRYRNWLHKGLNNAQLSTVGTYHTLVPEFSKILERLNYDFEAFYEYCEELGELSWDERREKLKSDVNRNQVL